jgi:uncharacterized protein YeaO (DUF488 family)
MIRVKDAFSKPKADDGERILIERLWPPGLMTYYSEIEAWLKDLGPSYDLQRFYFDRGNWSDYKRRYKEELGHRDRRAALEDIVSKAKAGTVTLIYGNRDPRHNNALIVREYIEENFLRRSDSSEQRLARESGRG